METERIFETEHDTHGNSALSVILRETTVVLTAGGRRCVLSGRSAFELARYLDEWGTGWPQHSAPSKSNRVFVLRLNFIILGVLTNEQRAIHEAKTLIEALTRLQREQWTELQKDRMWRSSDGRWLEIDAHDVR